MAGSGKYVVYAGEFRHVNGIGQQGMVRLVTRTSAPNTQGPKATGSGFAPTLSSPGPGQVRVNWTANFDYDNSDLTYTVLRDGQPDPVHTVTQASTWWQRPAMTFTDTGLSGGQHRYQVRVADPFGNSVSSTSVSITIAGPSNSFPIARFTPLLSARTLSVDGTASSDPDGTIVEYSWNWGDGQTGSGATASHTYASDGTYPVQLTVTDNNGAQDTTTSTVVIGTGQGPVAADTFGRTVNAGWGTADVGGSWSVNGSPSLFSVTGGAGVVTLGSAGSGPSAYLAGTSSAAVDVAAGVRMDKRANAGGLYAGLIGRRVGTSEYRMRNKIAPDGSVTIYISRLVGGVETNLQTVVVGGLTYQAGQRLNLRLQVTGSAPTTIRARTWLSTVAEPSTWQVSATDATSGLQSAGSVGLLTYVSGSATNSTWPLRFDDFDAQRI